MISQHLTAKILGRSLHQPFCAPPMRPSCQQCSPGSEMILPFSRRMAGKEGGGGGVPAACPASQGSINIPMVIRDGKPCGLKRMSGVSPPSVNGISSPGHSTLITPSRQTLQRFTPSNDNCKYCPMTIADAAHASFGIASLSAHDAKRTCHPRLGSVCSAVSSKEHIANGTAALSFENIAC